MKNQMNKLIVETHVMPKLLSILWLKRIKTEGIEVKSEPEETIAERLKLSDTVPLEGDEEEVKEGKGLKNLTPNKLLTRLPILLTQIKAGNNSYKK